MRDLTFTPGRSVRRRRVLSGLAAAPAALVLAGGGPAAPAAAGGRRPGRPAGPPRVLSAQPHPGLTAAFAEYGDSGDGWTGADSTYSFRLPGGRRLWMFSDTFLGTVNPDGSRPPDSPIVNNTFIVQQGAAMTTIHGGTEEQPEAILVAGTDQWYWLGGGYLGAGAVNIMFIRFQRTGPGMWDWVWRDNLLARFDPADLSLLSTHPMPSAAGVTWSSWLYRHGGHTYVYGTEDLGDTKHMHVARVAGSDLRAPWRFFDGTGWSPDEQDSARVMAGVANEYSVTRWNGRYLLVTHDTNVAFSNEILAYVADSPTGPFTSPTLLYRTPETGAFGSYGDPNVITYNSHEHPDLRQGNRLIVTYNVNSLDFQGVLDDVTKYRPRFIEVRLAP
jgi:3',5'-cyclic AMP phosphodiesterase CpdA